MLPTREAQRGTTKLSFLIAYLQRSLFCDTGTPRARILLTDTRGSSAISEAGVVVATQRARVLARTCAMAHRWQYSV